MKLSGRLIYYIKMAEKTSVLEFFREIDKEPITQIKEIFDQLVYLEISKILTHLHNSLKLYKVGKVSKVEKEGLMIRFAIYLIGSSNPLQYKLELFKEFAASLNNGNKKEIEKYEKNMTFEKERREGKKILKRLSDQELLMRFNQHWKHIDFWREAHEREGPFDVVLKGGYSDLEFFLQ